jgi:hypothetical protein
MLNLKLINKWDKKANPIGLRLGIVRGWDIWYGVMAINMPLN